MHQNRTMPVGTDTQFIPSPHWAAFVLAGAALYALMTWTATEPRPILGPPDPLQISQRSESFTLLTGRPPTAEEASQFADAVLHEALLFREALSAGLHHSDPAIAQRLVRNLRFLDPDTALDDRELLTQAFDMNLHLADEVIRRRLVQGMSALLIARAALEPPTDADIAKAYAARSASLTAPETISFTHVFAGEASDVAPEADTLTLGEQLTTNDVVPSEASQYGQPFLAGNHFEGASWVDISARFGPGFVRQLRRELAGSDALARWLGPIASTFGQHFVWIDEFQAARPLTIAEARASLRRDLEAEAAQTALNRAISRLMADYEVRR